ncbi:hypothetical protein AtubIFM61612_007245 [Aspergillus tubingensis]|nr:hypothetical protein AtubIFM61612_007245 [Aspergillus tubingensis]
MKFLSTLVASTLALAVSVQATDCTKGMKYCSGVLQDIGPSARHRFCHGGGDDDDDGDDDGVVADRLSVALL